MENLLEFMERCIWPVDPDADIMPQTLMPYVYGTESGEEDENVLKSLLVMLTVGLQGQCFNWRYKMDFDVIWSTEQKAYVVLLNSIRRMHTRGLDEKAVSETPISTPGAGAGAAESAPAATTPYSTPPSASPVPADFNSPETTE